MPENQYHIGGNEGPLQTDEFGKLLEGIGYPLRLVGLASVLPSEEGGDFTAEAGRLYNVNCTVADITVTLPDPSLNTGSVIFIRKADATAFKVIVTGLKDILFQNSVMMIMSDGNNWVIV